ncbi:MAG: glycosyl hydrolase 53 family protein [Candidatus Parvarchaeota archaeon]|nr:glycosyl hydrolase 53 family protein [Candidatus Jingweiarchaeum tengchongense]MCW1306112.1 glycosyl hydrolase 53 family protein [Candidatus Jingweiarchaeum tengchongense]
MKKANGFIVILIGLIIFIPFFVISTSFGAENNFWINPVKNVGSNFIKGADVSMLEQIEQEGGKYYFDGKQQNALQILKENGVNWIQIRLWNNPKDESGTYFGGGNNDENTDLLIARQAKEYGLKICLEFQYSDFWADPGTQNKPVSWLNDHGAKLEQDVYEFTSEVLKNFEDIGATPDMVIVGNEVNNGILWPDGQIYGSGGWSGFASLIQQGIKAVKSVDPKAFIMIHVADASLDSLNYFFDNLINKEHVKDFDVIGLSYYPYWDGSITQLKDTMNDLSEKFDKYIVVDENSYAWTLETPSNNDGTTNTFTASEQNSGGYIASVQGQGTELRDVIAAVSDIHDHKGLGVFYWGTIWIPVQGAGWKNGFGDAWANQAMFDFNGNALPSLSTFNLVSGTQTYITPKVVSIEPIEVSTTAGSPPTLPTEAKVIYSDASIRSLPVEWSKIKPQSYSQLGTFTIAGTITNISARIFANVKVTNKNYVNNPGFENGLTDWTVTGDTKAIFINTTQSDAYSGKQSLGWWSATPFKVKVYQKISNLANGYYTLSAYLEGSGGENELDLFVIDYGGTPLSVSVHDNGWRSWQHAVIPLIKVTNGQCTIGIYIDGNSNDWGTMDDVELVHVENNK